ncbi:HAD family hydrolase [Mycolicibacterium sp.]|jgi:beta-phosphoglucomutase-like phosphatase (HAD superfamily)|uniref:HAD family hydrolase n=1 Tax=Mycolicibacterium sp. TaxID=2320850 RepID=UPI0028AF45E3|nr:HAD family hydrolase [Mycolicibacterium sp.]
MSALRTSSWWNRSDRPAHLAAVIFSVDALLADSRADERLLAEAVWDLHCAGIRVAVVTAGHWPAVHRALRDLLGDGAVEVLVTGDEVGRPKPDPDVYQHALWQLGVRAVDAIAVEDSVAGLRAARSAGLTTVVVTTERTGHQDFTGAAAVLHDSDGPERLSPQRCRRLWESRLAGHRTTALTA